MERRIILLLLATLLSLGAASLWAQTPRYFFYQTNTTYSPSTGDQLPGKETTDDQISGHLLHLSKNTKDIIGKGDVL